MKINSVRFFLHYSVTQLIEYFGKYSIPFSNLVLGSLHTGLHIEALSGDESGLCRVTERPLGKNVGADARDHYFHLPERSHIYLRGVRRRGMQIASSYGIDQVNVEDNDIVIDIGANSGDLLIFLFDSNRTVNAYCFEPDPLAFRSLELNCKSYQGAFAINKALGEKSGSADFYLSSLGGDSSLSEPTDYDQKLPVECLALDNWLGNHESIPHNAEIKLIKLEAEGFEPEVLAGAKESLHRIRYIAADLGWERGKDQDCTIPQVVNLLLSREFEVERVSRDGVHYLFRNTRKGFKR